MRYVAIAGTWAQRDPLDAVDPWRDWWHPYSHWSATLRTAGHEPLRPDPYIWSTDLDGTWWQRAMQRRRYGDWLAAAFALCYYCGHRPVVRHDEIDAHHRAQGWRPGRKYTGVRLKPWLIAHSHGGQVALLAVGKLGLPVAGVITVCTPVRRDVLDVAGPISQAPWVHIYSDDADRWQWLGEWGDGVLRIARQMPAPAVNLDAAISHGHSGLLTTPEGIRTWPELLHRLGIDSTRGGR